MTPKLGVHLNLNSLRSTGAKIMLGESRGIRGLLYVILLVYFLAALVALIFNIPTVPAIKLSQYLSGLVVLGPRLDSSVQYALQFLMLKGF
ncbi:MAG: hypothetical protein QW767_00875 [Thermoprotei archaeon]